jgi:cathepsin F/cysteine peptidase B
MKLLIATAFVATAMGASLTEQFAGFEAKYNKKYNTVAEREHAMDCFAQNLKKIENLNKVNNVHGVNLFADECPEEFAVRLGYRGQNRTISNPAPLYSAEQLEKILKEVDSIDWVTKGAVTPVKDQGRCGSCWAFSSTGSMEGQEFVSKGKLTSMSEEELVQCSHSGNMGCNGGLMDTAFKWVISNKGIDSESDYPYTSGTGKTGTCDSSKLSNVVATYSSFKDLPHDEAQMAAWVAQNGPLSIAVDAQQHWQTYTGGIVNNCSGKQLDHGVLIVGYGTDNGVDYWKVKNSWSKSWGEEGYIRLARGSDQCGLTQVPCTIQV